LARRWRAEREDLWPITQQTAAAAIAWLIATHVIDHHEPFFAPISALVSLNTPLGERGLNALRLLGGVVLGIGVGEVVLLTLGGGYGTLALATFLALVLARGLGSARILRAHAAIGAILTMAVANGEVGPERITDALIGTGVALVFSQLLFSPEPVRLVRRVEANALASMADGLDLTARALEGDDALAGRAVASQRELRDHLSELATMRRASARVARHSLAWRHRITPVVHENEDAGHLDLLGTSCLLLTRSTLATAADVQRVLAPCVRALSATLAELAQQPGDRAARQHAVDRAMETLRSMRAAQLSPDPDVTVALTAARIAVADLMLFAGVDPDVARAATRPEVADEHNTNEVEVPARAGASTSRLRALARWLRRRLRRDAPRRERREPG
jgi:hypothetical protein